MTNFTPSFTYLPTQWKTAVFYRGTEISEYFSTCYRLIPVKLFVIPRMPFMPDRKEVLFGMKRISFADFVKGYRRNPPEPDCASCRPDRVRSNRGESGFTLVEIAIVIMIVGILTTIAVPNYLSYLERNKETTAISDINTIALRLKGYAMEGILPTDLSAINLGNSLPLIDPWGNPYKYLKLYGAPGNLPQARRDHNLVPINSDFDLYSMGPDGQSAKPLTAMKSRDDIVRANDGAFVGKASTYDP